MAEDEDRSSIEARLRSALDSLDQFSKRTSDSIASRMNRKEKAPSEKTVQERTAEIMDRARDGILRFNTGVSERIEGAQIGNRASKAKEMSLAAFRRAGLFLNSLLSYSPYLIPAIILLQASIWIGILSEGTLSNSLVSDLEVGMDESARNAWLVTSIVGASLAYLLMMSFDTGTQLLDVTSSSSGFDIISVLLLVSSVTYLLKSNKSLYYLVLAFGGSIVLRLTTTRVEDYNLLMILLCSMCLIVTFSALSVTFVKARLDVDDGKESGGPATKDSIDTSEILGHDFSETSYLAPSLATFEIDMDSAPINPPKRPTRRSEYELYEWVGLLANIILWPTTLIISMMIGSGYEVDGVALNMNDNFLMLVGPSMMTAFFFLMQYRMDASARDGSLYAAQKQAYLDEMEKYVEAKKAYLELVTLQAQIRKEQLMEENPNVRTNPAES